MYVQTWRGFSLYILLKFQIKIFFSTHEKYTGNCLESIYLLSNPTEFIH